MSDKLLENLDFISKIPKNTKPCFSTKSLIHTDEWFVTFRRRLKGEMGEMGVLYVNKLLNSCDKYYRMCKLDSNILKKALIKSLQGLQNLSHTYKKDKQHSVSESYNNCYNQVIKLINKINEKKSPNFFSYKPNIISDNIFTNI